MQTDGRRISNVFDRHIVLSEMDQEFIEGLRLWLKDKYSDSTVTTVCGGVKKLLHYNITVDELKAKHISDIYETMFSKPITRKNRSRWSWIRSLYFDYLEHLDDIDKH